MQLFVVLQFAQVFDVLALVDHAVALLQEKDPASSWNCFLEI